VCLWTYIFLACDVGLLTKVLQESGESLEVAVSVGESVDDHLNGNLNVDSLEGNDSSEVLESQKH
jgi:hypothetical protein